MPIEIRELIIRTTVDAAEEKPTGTGKPQPGTESILLGMKELARLIKEKNER
ncbi:DUF5908 family protein [Algoriphagus terrigena]|uniref:DUF5908 family protein n=1 Tax=Algoriphagus terrigena TaxID=344884 RepID=UPI0003F96D67|nr:DUF5908 family protein [Algoriphagus terrigena]